jgi:antirestriction protein ArdC
VAYIQLWSSFLKDKPHEILTAAKKADKAVEMITETLREMELNENRTEIKNNEKGEEER